jgi:indole-3-acetate monooxygenase
MLLTSTDARRLRADAAAADAAAAPTRRQLALAHRRGWLRLLAPQAAGGLECPLPEAVRFEEQLAEACGSTGWWVTLCAGAGWFAGFWAPALARQVMATRRVCVGGSGAAGQAVPERGGWRLHGNWAHASGAPWCTHFTLNAHAPDGLQRAFLLPAAQVQRQPGSWHSLGLRASASEAFAVQNAWVPADHAFDIRPEAAVADGPLYRFPFDALAQATLAANLSGLALAFLTEAEGALARPRACHLLPRWAAECAAFQALRAAFFAALDRAWTAAAEAPAMGRAALALARGALAAVQTVYPWCGLQAADPRSTLNRIWRDLHTASQHAQWLPAAEASA